MTPLLACACAKTDMLEDPADRIRSLFTLKQPPQPGDWLTEHKESGQTYREFREAVRSRTVDSFSNIRIVPIGEGTPQWVIDAFAAVAPVPSADEEAKGD